MHGYTPAEQAIRHRSSEGGGMNAPDYGDALRSNFAQLQASLALWRFRDDTKAQPQVRQAANHAMDTIDAMLTELHAIRSRLVSEIRASDDASAARADELLRRSRDESEETS